MSETTTHCILIDARCFKTINLLYIFCKEKIDFTLFKESIISRYMYYFEALYIFQENPILFDILYIFQIFSFYA